MGDILAALLVIIVPTLIVLADRRGHRHRLKRIDEALGLGLDPVWGPSTTRAGEVRGCAVALSVRTADRTRTLFRMTIQLPAPLPIAIRREPGRLRRALMGPDVQIGCPAFDALARLEGDEVMLRAVLYRRTRDALTPLLRDGGHFEGQMITAQWFGDDLGAEQPIRHALDAAAALRAAAEGVADPAEHLVQVAERDPLPGVRAGALRCMLRALPGDPRTWTATQAGLVDPDPGVRRIAATHLKRVDVLEGLLAPGVPEADQRAAVEALSDSPGGLDRVQARLADLSGTARAAALARCPRGDGRARDGGLTLTEDAGGGLALSSPTPRD